MRRTAGGIIAGVLQSLWNYRTGCSVIIDEGLPQKQGMDMKLLAVVYDF